MKNIHLIPTDKPSRLYSKDGRHILDTTMAIDWYISSACYKPQNIYITSDEKPKSGDWILDIKDNSVWVLQIQPNTDLSKYRRIILTTDPELINNGVQGIDDEFLNWYVNNPGCEYVIVTNLYGDYNPIEYFYEIIIPKEEPKQTDENGKPLTYWGGLAEPKQDKIMERFIANAKQEMLEEAAEKHVEINVAKNAAKLMYKEHFIAGAKWQAKEMYSEQEAFNLLMEFSSRDRNSSSGTPHSIADWFEKNKKK